VNVIAPADATPGSRLPVVIVSSIFISAVADYESYLVDPRRRFRNWGDQYVSDSSSLLEHRNGVANCLLFLSYPGSVIVNKAINLTVPAIYVSMNYR